VTDPEPGPEPGPEPASRDDAPTVSVVVPVYNGAAVIGPTLRSLLGQTVTDIEVIVVDDGSTDDTPAVVGAAAAADARLRLQVQEENRGRSAARNAGMAAARGRWVAFCDADDLWAPDRLEQLLGAAARFADTRLVTDDQIQFWVGDGGRVRLGHRFPTRSTWWVGEPHRIRVREWYLDLECPMRPLIRADLLAETGATFPEDMSAGEDLAFQLELVFHPGGAAPVRLPRPMYYYREGESSRATNQAVSRLRLNERVAERTANPQFVRWARRSDPGRLFMHLRADALLEAAGRGAPRDAAADGVEVRASAWRGYARLVFGKILQIVASVLDRRFRPSIVADIERQLAAG